MTAVVLGALFAVVVVSELLLRRGADEHPPMPTHRGEDR